MWVNSAVRGRGSFARQDVFDGSSSDNDQGDNGGGGVETVGTVDDEPDAAVGSFVAAIRSHRQLHAFAMIWVK